jgi:hypothetical protein
MPDEPAAVPQPPPNERLGLAPLVPPWTRPRIRLLRWLKAKAPSLAELYESAVILLDDRELPGRSRIICHCVREIANALPAILAGVERTRLEYDKRLDEISKIWDQVWAIPIVTGPQEAIPVPESRLALNQDLLRLLQELIDDHKATRAKRLPIAARLFQADRPENRHLGDTLVPVLRQWVDLKDWFVSHAHDGGKTDAQQNWTEIKRNFSLFEETVLTLGESFFLTIQGLDDLLQNESPEQIDQVMAHLGHVEHYRYFFERAQNPGWIAAFRGKRIFRHPPPVEPAGIPRWAASEFLVRITERADPNVVIETILEIAQALALQSPPNAFVIRDLTQACVQLPGQHLTRIIPKLKAWVKHPHGRLFWRHMGRLMGHLAQERRPAEALSLLTELLQVERNLRPGTSEIAWLSSPVRPQIDVYEYRQIVDKELPLLVEITARQVVELLCNTLERAARFSRRRDSTDEHDDNSDSWRPSLEQDEDPDRDDVRNILVSAVRETAEHLAQTSPQDLRSLIGGLETRGWLIFQRLAYHLLGQALDPPRDMIAAHLTNPAAFHNIDLRREYGILLQKYLYLLSPIEQQTILGWIEAGSPNVERWIENITAFTGNPPTDKDIAEHQRHWQWQHLVPIQASLPEAWRERYAVLAEEFGHPEPQPARAEYRRVSVGDHSPRTPGELQALTTDALREYLVRWEPDRQVFPPQTRSGLAQVLTELATEDPSKFSRNAEQWKGLDPTYLHGIIRGLSQGLNQGRAIDWAQALGLCDWILQQPSTIPGRTVINREDDRDWGGTRWWVVELLRLGFQHKTLPIPLNLRQTAWRLLEILTNDPDPAPEEEDEDYGRPEQSLHRAINSIRGRAIEGIMYYPDWIRQQNAQATGTELSEAPKAQLPPEAIAILERHLDQREERTLAIRSLYGRWIPWLIAFNTPWATAAVPRIFPVDNQRAWLIAWDSFICFNPPYEEVFDPLQSVYRLAVEHLSTDQTQADDTRHLREERLAAHLTTFYWRGHYNLEEADSLLKRFFAVAPDKIRAEAIEHIGRSLERTAQSIDPTVLDRLERLWLWRLGVCRQDPGNHQAELRSFGWWFSSAKSDAGWAIEQLHQVLTLAGGIDPDYLVMEQLAEQVQAFPQQVLNCTRLLIEGQPDHLEIMGWAKDLRVIFAHAQRHESPDIWRASNEIIELLGRRGDLGYRDLLHPEN